MGRKEEIFTELESTRREFHLLVASVPVESYRSPSANSAWTIGDVLYHITLGPPAIRAEVWMIRYADWLFSAVLNNGTARIFNWGNALFARHPKQISPQILIKSYENGNSGLLTSLKGIRNADFDKSIHYPDSFVKELAGIVTVERLFRYIKLHFEIHASQIRESLG
jgi:hypothetical protein